MATICLLSAKGSPGVTTTTVALTSAWAGAAPGRRAIAIDADPIGGDFAAGVLRGAMPLTAGMLALATTRGTDPSVAIDSAAVHLRRDGTARVIPGVPDRARAGALPLAWDVLCAAGPQLGSAGSDLLIDAGRVEPSTAAAPWLAECDRAVLLVRPTLPAVTAARRLAAHWTTAATAQSGVPLELVVVASPSPYSEAEVAGAIGLPLLGTIPFDPETALVHSAGMPPTRGFARSGYARGIHRIATDLAARLELHQPETAESVEPEGPSPSRWAAWRAGSS